MADPVIPKEMWFKMHLDKYRETRWTKTAANKSKVTTQMCPLFNVHSLDNVTVHRRDRTKCVCVYMCVCVCVCVSFYRC